MSPYKNAALYTAIAVVCASLAMQDADAVQMSRNGRGEVLLYPYYTTRADSSGFAYSTLLSVVNATAVAKAVKVKFLEGKNSREVFNFNLFLSPFDVWTAAVLPDLTGAGAKVGTFDTSCTLPAFSASPTAPFVSFVNFAYAGANDDGAGTSLDRTKEGHFEIIEMATYASSSTTGKAVTHLPRTTPPFNLPLCGADLNDGQASLDAQPPTGGLFGSGTLINVEAGTEYSFEAVALSHFHETGPQYYPPGAPLPDLTQASPPVSTVLAPNGLLYESQWTAGTADAVSAVLMHDNIRNEYVLDTATKSATDWVVTLPTKRFYTAVNSGSATKLFQRNFNGTAGSCDYLQTNLIQPETVVYDREERSPPRVLFSNAPFLPLSVCWAANVWTFNPATSNVSTLFNSVNSTGIPAIENTQRPFENGWFNMRFPVNLPAPAFANVHRLINTGATTISGGGRPTSVGNTVTYVGLPVIGFAAVSYTNGSIVVGGSNVLSNYGGNFVHKASTLIQ